MDLIVTNTPAAKRSDGSTVLTIPAGQWLRIQYGSAQTPTTVLQEQVPANKQWAVSITVNIQETAA